jgi:hypothetical protein
MSKKNAAKAGSRKPFGIEFLVDVPEVETIKVNGGAKLSGPPRFHTMYVSLRSKAFPHGDHG